MECIGWFPFHLYSDWVVVPQSTPNSHLCLFIDSHDLYSTVGNRLIYYRGELYMGF